MTGKQLRKRLRVLFGEEWRLKLVINIGKDYATLKRWMNGELVIPQYVTVIIELLEATPPKHWPERWRNPVKEPAPNATLALPVQ